YNLDVVCQADDEAGYAFVIPFGMEKMHLFPRNMLVLELSAYAKEDFKSPTHTYDRAAKIQTSDGFYVDVDVTILYRISDAYKVITTLGPGTLYLTNGLLPKAEPILKQTLGELRTEDFYNSPLRVEKAHKAQEILGAEIAPKGLQVDQVLIRYFKYSDEIQKNIEAKKLQDQLVFKNQAEAKAAMEEAKLKRVTQEGEMNVKVTLQEGEAYMTQKSGDRELYVRRKGAEGNLIVRSAEADAVEWKNEAMQTLGNDRKVAMEMAKVLEGIDTLIVPSGPGGINPLDLQSMVGLFGVQKQEGGAPPKPHTPFVAIPAAPETSAAAPEVTQ
ncbi:MAG TPA: SPFH domain-containing protein, partial [Candidatus Hydrogenedentes bacterium]|nr:SPFH domain-containing protein [Candidatus Hydrogenedentota bacterium]